MGLSVEQRVELESLASVGPGVGRRRNTALPLFGAVAIYLAHQVSSKWITGDVTGARKAPNNAKTWVIVTVVAQLLLATSLIPYP
jgi:hypothetical protein